MIVATPAARRLQELLPPVSAAVRVPPAPVQLLRPLASVLAVVGGRLTGTGPLAIFTTLGRNPRLFRAWLFYSAQLMPFGTLPRRDAELVILRVAWQCGTAYEWWQHVPLALRAGLGGCQITAVTHDTRSADLSERQQMLLAFTDDLLARRALSEATWQAAARQLTDPEVIELCLLVGHYVGLATAIGGLGIQLEQRT